MVSDDGVLYFGGDVGVASFSEDPIWTDVVVALAADEVDLVVFDEHTGWSWHSWRTEGGYHGSLESLVNGERSSEANLAGWTESCTCAGWR